MFVENKVLQIFDFKILYKEKEFICLFIFMEKKYYKL